MGQGKKNIRVKAPAKVNLFLRITGKRPDGYHLLDSLMVPISLWDSLEIEVHGFAQPHIRLFCEDPAVPDGEANLAYRAAALLLEEAGVTAEVTIRLKKAIPAGSGLGGGSSDAASVLKGLGCLLALNLPEKRLMALGVRLGADVPFFLCGRPARIRGIGEAVYPLESFPPLWLAVVVPPFSVSTAWAYARFDELPQSPPSRMPRLDLFLAGSLPAGDLLLNDLEKAVFPHHPPLAELKRALRDLGATGAAMSGSGSALFGIFRTREEARKAARRLAGQGKVFVVKILESEKIQGGF